MAQSKLVRATATSHVFKLSMRAVLCCSSELSVNGFWRGKTKEKRHQTDKFRVAHFPGFSLDTIPPERLIWTFKDIYHSTMLHMRMYILNYRLSYSYIHVYVWTNRGRVLTLQCMHSMFKLKWHIAMRHSYQDFTQVLPADMQPPHRP